jgi:hypothetical protein
MIAFLDECDEEKMIEDGITTTSLPDHHHCNYDRAGKGDKFELFLLFSFAFI